MYANIVPIPQLYVHSRKFIKKEILIDNEIAENKEPIPSVPIYFYLSYTVVFCVVFEF